ncbi:MAG: response regulator, partial [Lachnospiraceae bacterium]|nr:response regulator [Lachnospiraceae bacterium]
KEAVEKVMAADPGYYDAVLMDIQMPVMDGYEAAKAIRALEDKEKAGIPIVAMTANAFSEDVKKAQSVGMNAHIAKPIDVNAMVNTLHDILG